MQLPQALLDGFGVSNLEELQVRLPSLQITCAATRQ
jgi:hypothetical protein